ncbi:putative flavonol 3-sulfotransferase [Helianthus annuus]|uniref:Sulfotransferase n=1 Tax=Helianthus annuus TaxID=4232 RepID=A0A9K3DPP2_HELAN|nr:putative flavonol 3-sulfotransferase [Helianthus annuus]KAJ0819221.1 putative flavonol 3-sulfotransferase [Helianthus annuus]
MEETIKTFPQHTCSWLKGKFTFYKNQDFWNIKKFHEGGILAQQSFEAQPSDVFLCSPPKTGTVWLKALAFAIITREKYDESTSPLLTTMPHECIPLLEKDLEQIEENHKNSCFPLVATHLPYNSLPESILSSNCRIVYIYRNIKDVIVSHYHFLREAIKLPLEDAPFEEAFDEFCEGVSWFEVGL